MNPAPLAVDLAIPRRWWQDAMFLEIYFYGLLRRSSPGTKISVNTIQNDGYNGVGVMKCDAVVATACSVAAARINDAMRITDPQDQFSKLRDLASEDERDKAEIDRLVDEFLRERGE